MHVEIDEETCQGAGFCVRVAPTVFQMGDDDIAVVLTPEVDPALHDDVDEAERLCPMGAVIVDQ